MSFRRHTTGSDSLIEYLSNVFDLRMRPGVRFALPKVNKTREIDDHTPPCPTRFRVLFLQLVKQFAVADQFPALLFEHSLPLFTYLLTRVQVILTHQDTPCIDVTLVGGKMQAGKITLSLLRNSLHDEYHQYISRFGDPTPRHNRAER